MQNIRLAAASVNQIPLDWQGNRQHLLEVLAKSREAGVQVLCLPELAITGYGCEDMFFSVGVQQAALRELEFLLPETQGMVVAVGLPLFYESCLYNAAAVIADGELLGFVCKQFMASDGIHYEPRWFKQWPARLVGQMEWNGQLYPVGDLLFDCGGVRVGLEICRDAWVAERPGARHARHGADFILNPSASHFAFSKQAVRERIALEGSRTFCAAFVYCNLLGNESGRSVYDGGTLVATGGKIVARGRLFSYQSYELTVTDIDIEANRRARGQSFDSGVKVGNHDESLVDMPFDWQASPLPDLSDDPTISQSAEPATWEVGDGTHSDGTHSDGVKFEEFSRVVPLALFDYLRKSHAQGFVVSLSGGADSAAVALLVALMVRRALDELGPEEFLARLGSPPELLATWEAWNERPEDSANETAANPRALAQAFTRSLLACAYQPTRNSTDTTRNAASTVAQAIGAEFYEWDVDQLSEHYVQMVSQAVGREITWQTDDLSLQNIQARTRGPGVWLLANLRGAILLATSNRSEAAVGYATMDGDTCGGLSPVAGIDKRFLRSWLRWMETTGPEDLGPIEELSAVNAQQPTAELRPSVEGQTDESDLMPYDVLDAIERAAIRDKQLPADVLHVVAKQYPQHEHRQMGVWVIRFFELWCRNQWKRERYAPSFHVDDENLDPKSWCRFPLLNSGFEEELQSLRKELGI